MSNESEEKSSKVLGRLHELLDYVHHVGTLNQRPVFKLDEYKQLNLWEHQLKGKIGIQHNIIDADGVSIWLRVERLKRISPPIVPEQIKEWVSIGNDPDSYPQIKDKLIKTLPAAETSALVDEGVVRKADISDPLMEQPAGIELKDVIFRLENLSQIKKEINDYLNEQWLPWSEEEKPRRVTIKIYDSLFSLQQTIEAQGDEQPIELIWGVGIVRWLCEGHKIDHPLLEKPIEIVVDSKEGSILINPRNIEPTLAVSAFFALENPGIDALIRFGKKHFSELSDDIEFSPYIHESFEPVLRQASMRLSERGVYWPDVNPDKENRLPNDICDYLEVTDSWVIFARPRNVTEFVADIERFQKKLENSQVLEESIPKPTRRLVSELSNKKPLSTGIGIYSHGGSSSPVSPVSASNQKISELYFPKAFNESQVQIIDRLEENDGVVVQGPPGTGKTHTIANIICHYLATGRSVLVTSKGESALSVLQEQIPEVLRTLTISLLTNERQGMKQLETAVQQLAGLVSQTNLRDLEQESYSQELRIKQLKNESNLTDTQIKNWGLKQLTNINEKFEGVGSNITAMELAQLVMNDSGAHEWLSDELGSSEEFSPIFTDSDIARIRIARRKVGTDIVYATKNLPKIQDMPDSVNIASIHDDLVKSGIIADDAKKSCIPPLAVSLQNSVERAKKLVKPLEDLAELLEKFDHNGWLKQLFYLSTENFNSPIPKGELNGLFQDLLQALSILLEKRNKFLKSLIEINYSPSSLDIVTDALKNLVTGKRPFGIFNFGNKEAKAVIEKIRIDGEQPKSTEQWQFVLDYLTFQDEIRRFILKWNYIGDEYELPKFDYTFGGLFKEIQSVYTLITNTISIAEGWNFIRRELSELFPLGIDVAKLIVDKSEINKAIHAIELNTSRIRLGAQRLKLNDLMTKLKQSDGEISNQVREFINYTIGNPDYTTDNVLKEWQGFIDELNRLDKLTVFFNDINEIAEKIFHSGAKLWSEKLKSVPVLSSQDDLTPVDWYQTWQWKRRKQFLHEIDGRDQLKKLSSKRSNLDLDLKRTFTDLVRLKTNIGLHLNMTERVQGALMRFVSSVAKIGTTGKGKRAPRHRRDAYRAMQDCYGGVPCWIMPTWRVSESLPSEFGSFDLVIIDEASQSDITALPAIMRGKKLLIVGDDKQVSPTAAFLAEEKILQLRHNFLKDQPFAELFLPGVSIYDLANSVFPGQRIMLTEHFRCVEPIIRFSMQFYDVPLIPLRIAKTSERLTPPLIDVYVKDGVRDERRKINEKEAEGIISEIQSLINDPKFKNRSIGVVSLIGSQQSRYIQDRLLTLVGEDAYQNYQISCGDPVSFQGKERDIVFLSLVVGPGQGAVMNKREYEQRTNVALSRAKDRMYLYRSIQESDLRNESDLRLKIIRHFSNPMPQNRNVENPIELCDSDFERSVFKKLNDKGYNVTPQVRVGPFSIDIVVEGENDRRLAVELDGDKYHPPEKWMDDWKRQRTMERVGWKFWRCWGSSYIIDPEGCIDDLENVLNSMEIHPSKSSTNANIYTEHRVYEWEGQVNNDVPEYETAGI